MPLYNYKAKNKSGKIVKGLINGANAHEIEDLLKQDGLKLVASSEDKSRGLFERKAIPVKEKVSLCRYMALIIRSGLSMSEGLNLLANGTSNKTVRRIIDNVAIQAREGKSLFMAFQQYQEQFGSAFMTVVKSGETSGTLAESFEYLADHFQQEKELKGKVMSALLYPCIILGLMFVVGVILFTFVLPRLAEVFTKMNIKLPFFTELMFKTSLAFQDNMMIVGVGALVFVAVIVIGINSKPGKKLIQFLMVRIPVVKTLVRDYNLVRFTQSLSALMKSGVPVTEAVELSVDTLSFVKTAELRKEFSEKLTKGVSLSQVFREAKIFPVLMVQLMTIGEKTGNIESLLTDLTEFYQDEVENSLKNFVTALEPTLMILVGIGVGAMVISVISPIYSLIGQLQAGL